MISYHQRTVLTYEALDLKSDSLARGLEKLGVSKGDRVAVSLGNNIEYATVSTVAHPVDSKGSSHTTTALDDICAVQAWSYSGRIQPLHRYI